MRIRTMGAGAVITACAISAVVAGAAHADTSLPDKVQQKFVVQDSSAAAPKNYLGFDRGGPTGGMTPTTLDNVTRTAADYLFPSVGTQGQILLSPDWDETYRLCLTADWANPGTPGWQADPSTPRDVYLAHCKAGATNQQWTLSADGRITSPLGGAVNVVGRFLKLTPATSTRLVSLEQTTVPDPGDGNEPAPAPPIDNGAAHNPGNSGYLPDGTPIDGGFTAKSSGGTGAGSGSGSGTGTRTASGSAGSAASNPGNSGYLPDGTPIDGGFSPKPEPEVTDPSAAVGPVRLGSTADTKVRAVNGGSGQQLLGAYSEKPTTFNDGSKAQSPRAGATGPIAIGKKCLTFFSPDVAASFQTCDGTARQQFTNETLTDGTHVLKQGDRVLTASKSVADKTLKLLPLDEKSSDALQRFTVG